MHGSGKGPATYADLETLPDAVTGELIGGELFASPRPSVGCIRASTVLAMLLARPFDLGIEGPANWWMVAKPELHLGADVVVPDLGGWRRERLASPPRGSDAFITLAPDWICEVLSPSTARLDFEKKLPVYARAGVRHAWFLNPQMRALEVFRLESGAWLLAQAFSGDQKVRAEPFDAIELDLTPLWM